MNARVLDISEIEEILEFEKRRQLSGPEAEIAGWNAPWRREALEFYLPKGWCFALRGERGELKAYFLAQPLLFFNAMTQTLWVEHLSYESEAGLTELMDLARRYGRDKHLQKVLVSVPTEVDLSPFGARRFSPGVFEFDTTRMSP